MDLLFNRYASPFLLLDNLIDCGRFAEFVNEFLSMHNKRVQDEEMFEIWLHKVWDKGYSDFCAECQQKEVVPQNVDFETTIHESMNILKGFRPESE